MLFPFNAGEVFKIALRLEEKGSRFYEAAAAKPFSAEIRDLFQKLAKAEKGHQALLTGLLAKVPPAGPTVWEPDNELDQYLKMMADQHVFSRGQAELDRQIESLTDFSQALVLAMSFEKDTIVFFLELMSAADNPESREQMKKLVDEERGHLRRLARFLAGK
jgi:rubrerythrin